MFVPRFWILYKPSAPVLTLLLPIGPPVLMEFQKNLSEFASTFHVRLPLQWPTNPLQTKEPLTMAQTAFS